MYRNDTLWKGLMEDIFSGFIPFFLPEYLHLFDLEKPVEFLDKELQQLYPEHEKEQQTKFVDKLVKVFTKTGKEQWILIHIEVQGYRDTDFARRMFTYFYRILDRYQVAVTAIAIFTDDAPGFAPSQYEYDFAGTQNIYRFNTYKVLQQSQEELEQSKNPFAIAILTVLLALKKKKLPDQDLLQLKIKLYKTLRLKDFSPEVARSLFTFIKLYVNFEKPEMHNKFDKEIEQLTNKNNTMGIVEQVLEQAKQEGLAKGMAKGMAEGKAERDLLFVTNLLQSTDFSDEKIAALAGVSLAFVQQVKHKK